MALRRLAGSLRRGKSCDSTPLLSISPAASTLEQHQPALTLQPALSNACCGTQARSLHSLVAVSKEPHPPSLLLSSLSDSSWHPGSHQLHRSSIPGASPLLHQQQARGVFGARAAARTSPQLHTHDKYKFRNPQPSYDWMLGRFVMDRNGTVWHKRANRASKRYKKNSGTLQRLKRWTALQDTQAAKFRKLPGVKEMLRYWAPPDPAAVPGFGGDAPYRNPPRRKVKADRRPHVGDPALLPH